MSSLALNKFFMVGKYCLSINVIIYYICSVCLPIM